MEGCRKQGGGCRTSAGHRPPCLLGRGGWRLSHCARRWLRARLRGARAPDRHARARPVSSSSSSCHPCQSSRTAHERSRRHTASPSIDEPVARSRQASVPLARGRNGVEGIVGLVLAGLALTGSPGPANVALAAAGAAFGARGGLGFMAGIVAGMVVVMAVIGFGVAGLVLALPGAVPVLSAAAAAYFLWL